MRTMNKRRRFRWDRLALVVLISVILLKAISAVIDYATYKKTESITIPVIVTETVASEVETEEIEILTEETTEVIKPTHYVAEEQLSEETTGQVEETTDEVYYSERLQRYISENEMYNLIMISCSEAGCESYEGKVAVAATVLNRMEDPAFPDDVYGVVFQQYQFSSASNGKFYNGAGELRYEDIDDYTIEEAKTAVKAALAGEDPTREYTGGALYFYNPDYCSYEENAMRSTISCTCTIGNHIFYRVWD